MLSKCHPNLVKTVLYIVHDYFINSLSHPQPVRYERVTEATGLPVNGLVEQKPQQVLTTLRAGLAKKFIQAFL